LFYALENNVRGYTQFWPYILNNYSSTINSTDYIVTCSGVSYTAKYGILYSELIPLSGPVIVGTNNFDFTPSIKTDESTGEKYLLLYVIAEGTDLIKLQTSGTIEIYGIESTITNILDTSNITPEAIGAASVSEVESLKTSVSEGKALIAAAVTDKGVSTAANDSFATMASNISSIASSSSMGGVGSWNSSVGEYLPIWIDFVSMEGNGGTRTLESGESYTINRTISSVTNNTTPYKFDKFNFISFSFSTQFLTTLEERYLFFHNLTPDNTITIDTNANIRISATLRHYDPSPGSVMSNGDIWYVDIKYENIGNSTSPEFYD
jgi:hypothetical protein